MKQLAPIVLLLSACSDKLPTTFEAYKNQTIMQVKKLSKTDKKALYTNTFQQRASDFTGTTSTHLQHCLHDVMGDDSGFVMFSKLVDRCAGRYIKNPTAFNKIYSDVN